MKNVSEGKGKSVHPFAFTKYVYAASVFRALNNKLRQKILLFIYTNADATVPDMRVSVSDIYKQLGIEQSDCSDHLSLLRKAGIIYYILDGKCRYYYINNDMINVINSTANILHNTRDVDRRHLNLKSIMFEDNRDVPTVISTLLPGHHDALEDPTNTVVIARPKH